MQADTAVTPEIIEQTYPFSTLKGGANVLIFPDLESGNIAYKLLVRLGGADPIGPIILGMSKPVYVLPRGADVKTSLIWRRSPWWTRRDLMTRHKFRRAKGCLRRCLGLNSFRSKGHSEASFCRRINLWTTNS